MKPYPDIARSPFIRRTSTAIAAAAGSWAIAGTAESQPVPHKNPIKAEALAQPVGHMASVAALKVRGRIFRLSTPEAPHKTKRHKRRLQHPQNHSQAPLTPAQRAEREVSPQEFAAWSKVNVCEEGGDWHVEGPTYSGGLGISNVNWDAYGGEVFAENGGEATPKEQIVIAEHIRKNPPDQNGCEGGW